MDEDLIEQSRCLRLWRLRKIAASSRKTRFANGVIGADLRELIAKTGWAIFSVVVFMYIGYLFSFAFFGD